MVETNKKQVIRRTLTRWLWWAAFIASIALTLAALPGYAQNVRELELSIGFATLQQTAVWLGTFFSVGSAVLCLALALLVFLKRPGEPMALFVSFILLIYGVVLVGPLELFLEYWIPQSSQLALQLQSILLTTLLLALILIFPNGRFTPRWTRWIMVLAILLTMGELLTFNTDDWVRMSTTRAQIGYAFITVLLLLAMAIQVYRYRRIYGLAERQQTKWVLIGLTAMFISFFIISIPYYYLVNLPGGTPQPWWAPLGGALWWFSLTILPVSLTIAILRYRLWDIDIIIRRTLVYGALTVTLALVYFGSVVLLQRLIGFVTGQVESPVAIVVSTLVIAALFNPLRHRIQNDIDRRFYRRKYDAEKTLAAFSASLRDEVELSTLSNHLVAVVQETMQPENINLWLKKRER
jgi:hypothetical protein